jgi:hypothetical protein
MEVDAGILEKEELRRSVVHPVSRVSPLTKITITPVHVSPRKRMKRPSSWRSATRKRSAARRRKKNRGSDGDHNARSLSDNGTLYFMDIFFIPSLMWNPPCCLS